MKDLVTKRNSVLGMRHHVIAVTAILLALLATLSPGYAFAADSYKGYSINATKTPVYSSSNLEQNTKIGSVYAGDEVTLNCYNDARTSINITYPLDAGGTKTGWVQTSAFLTATRGPSHTSVCKYRTYCRPNGETYGWVCVGDKVNVLGTKDGYTQIVYNLDSGGFKFAWAKTNDVNAGKGSSSSGGSGNSSVQQRLDQIANGSLCYNSSTNMKLNTKFSGTRSSEQCKGFAKNVFYLCFKVTPGSTQSKPNNYLINGTSGMTRVGYYSSITSSKAQSLFSKARPGDFVQMRRKSSGGSHSAIVYSVSSSGITFFEANTDGKNTVMKNTYTWSQLASKNSGMSLYAASDYSLK